MEIAGIIIEIVCIIYGEIKGINILILAPCAAIAVIISNEMPFFATLIGLQNSYMRLTSKFKNHHYHKNIKRAINRSMEIGVLCRKTSRWLCAILSHERKTYGDYYVHAGWFYVCTANASR